MACVSAEGWQGGHAPDLEWAAETCVSLVACPTANQFQSRCILEVHTSPAHLLAAVDEGGGADDHGAQQAGQGGGDGK